MAGETVITIVGNLTADPELRFTPSGAAVADFTVASTPRTFDRQASEWKNGDSLFMRCNIWREAAENVAESLRKGMRVIVQGRLYQRSYETREGERRTVVECQVDEVGPSLRRAKATVTRSHQAGPEGYAGQHGSVNAGGHVSAYSGQVVQGPPGHQQHDPYAQAPRQADGPVYGGGQPQQGYQQPQGDPWAAQNDEPPF